MSYTNKVVWADGYLLRSQHFQQERRYLEHLIDYRVRSLLSYGWGYNRLEVDRDLLAIGKFGVSSTTGIFPDGTPLVLPGEDHVPVPLDLDPEIKSKVVFLCLPVKSPGQQEISFDDNDILTRHALREVELRDETSAQAADTALVQVAAIEPELRLEDSNLEGFVAMPVARIQEVRSDNQVLLDDSYIPPMLDIQASNQLTSVVSQIRSLLQHRGSELSGRVTASGRGGTAEIADFLMLQVVNRNEPLFAHYSACERLHPRYLYESAVQLAGELATFSESGASPQFTPYDHDNLEIVFADIMSAIRDGLERILVRRAEPIPLKTVREGQLYSAHIADSSLLSGATFVLGVSGDMSTEKLRGDFPKSAKLAAQEDIREVVQNLLQGIPVNPLPVAPRQIKFSAGSVYFELDSSVELWSGLNKTSSMVIHLDQSLPEVELELWAIRH